MGERERREREIFADFLAGAPVEDDAGELDLERLMQVGGTLARMQVVSVIRAGEAEVAWPGGESPAARLLPGRARRRRRPLAGPRMTPPRDRPPIALGAPASTRREPSHNTRRPALRPPGSVAHRRTNAGVFSHPLRAVGNPRSRKAGE